VDLLDRMATLVRVFETGSFSAAAKALRVSPAAVSRQVGTLESSLGVTLLRRTTRRMAPTDAGRRYYEHCVRILREVEEARSVGARDEAAGVLRVSAPVSFGVERVAPHLPALLRAHPGLVVDLRIEDRYADLSLDGVDVAIRVGGGTDASAELVAHRLMEMPRWVVASPAYLRRHGTPRTPEELPRHAALSPFTGGPRETWTLTSAEREARVPMTVRLRCNSLPALRDLAIAGEGVMVVSAPLVAAPIAERRLRRVLPEWTGPAAAAYAIHRKTLRGTARVRALVEHLRRAYAPQTPADVS